MHIVALNWLIQFLVNSSPEAELNAPLLNFTSEASYSIGNKTYGHKSFQEKSKSNSFLSIAANTAKNSQIKQWQLIQPFKNH